MLNVIHDAVHNQKICTRIKAVLSGSVFLFSSRSVYANNMRLKTAYIIGILLIIWTLFVLFTFTNRPLVLTDSHNSLDDQLAGLEGAIEEEFRQNSEMIVKMQALLENRKQQILAEDSSKKEKKKQHGFVIPVLVIACNRVSVSRCLDQLIQHRPDPDSFPIVVSQDCNHKETTDMIAKYGSQVTLIKQPDQSDIEVLPQEKKFKGYFKIARHYGWALNQTFFNFNFDAVIIVEDDLEVSPDFFEYFRATYPLLLQDPTLWCISAWNDNGKIGLVNENRPELLYRTDFFPGLGWMLTKDLWTELSTKWPKSYWDDWIRQPAQRKERACIRPEISRTKTFGKIGVSNGMFFEKHLKYIKLNDASVRFTQMDLNYLVKDAYDTQFVKKVFQCPVVSYQELKEDKIVYDGPVRIVYHTKDAFKRNAKLLGLMDDFRSGVPRMAYQGIVTFFYKKRTVHLAPSFNWKGYDLSWS